MTREKKANIFFHWIGCHFSKNCVFHNLLGVKEMTLYLPQYLLEYIGDPYDLFPEVFHVG